jgi:hypothetical protein
MHSKGKINRLKMRAKKYENDTNPRSTSVSNVDEWSSNPVAAEPSNHSTRRDSEDEVLASPTDCQVVNACPQLKVEDRYKNLRPSSTHFDRL